jgi:hypothetical protein
MPAFEQTSPLAVTSSAARSGWGGGLQQHEQGRAVAPMADKCLKQFPRVPGSAIIQRPQTENTRAVSANHQYNETTNIV